MADDDGVVVVKAEVLEDEEGAFGGVEDEVEGAGGVLVPAERALDSPKSTGWNRGFLEGGS